MPARPDSMRGLVFIATLAGFLSPGGAAGQDGDVGTAGESAVLELRQVVADLSADDFGRRERAMRLLWESGDEVLVAEIVRHGATAEARVRAAQVLSSYRWGIVPGVTDPVRDQLERFRNGDTGVRTRALAALMQMGELRAAARCFFLVRDAVERHRLDSLIRASMETTVPRECIRGRSGEVGEFLAVMAAAEGDYRRDLDAFQRLGAGTASIPVEGIVSAAPDDGPSLLAGAPAQLIWGGAPATVLASLDPGRDEQAAAALDLLHCRGDVAGAVELLREVTDAAADLPAADVISAYIAREVAGVKVQLYSKNALNIPRSVDYQPAGVVLSDGLRNAIAFCREYGLKEVVREAGVALVARLDGESPAALPVFATWAGRYPELRDLAAAVAMDAHRAGVPSEFAFAPVVDEWSLRGRWFGQFVSRRERIRLLESGARSGGWGALAMVDPGVLPATVRGQVAMSTGDWSAAADAFAGAAENADTLAFGAVQAFFASMAHDRAGDAGMAERWRKIAELVPLGNEPARAAVADVMQRFGDHEGARRNRMLLLHLHSWKDGASELETPEFVQALRLLMTSAELETDHSARALAPVLSRALDREVAGAPYSLTGLGELLRNRAMLLHCELAEALAVQEWGRAEAALRAAHQCLPGELRPFSMFARRVDSLPGEIRSTVRALLAATSRQWERAFECLPDNARCARELQRCRAMAELF